MGTRMVQMAEIKDDKQGGSKMGLEDTNSNYRKMSMNSYVSNDDAKQQKFEKIKLSDQITYTMQ